MKKTKAYSWVPSLYFAEALPYVAVMAISTTMYKKMGLSNTDLALYTSWLYLPWVIKPLWSPFIDAIKTKRWWIITMQLLIGAGCAGIALTLPTALWLKASLAFFWLMAFSSATHDIAADGFYILAHDSHEQAFYVGIRSTFYRIATIFGQGALIMLAGKIEKTGNIPLSWSLVFFVITGFFLIATAYHKFILPKVEYTDADHPNKQFRTFSALNTLREFYKTLKIFFSKPQIVSALLFMLLFRFPEAQLVKIVNPFMLDPIEKGGMGLETGTVGFVYGTIGIIGLTLGGLLGGFVVAKDGLKKWFWWMVLSISLPDAVYIYLGATQTGDLLLINTSVFIEQFGYGFGFTAYMLYLIYFSRGENSTSIYAICTAFMALGMMLPGMIAGKIADMIGYENFFIWIMASCIITVGVSALLKIDPEFGKKK
ncbi:MAG: MFS transporter [Bacteroides sp.]|nr:MFS transporter [Bacteroides sp.]